MTYLYLCFKLNFPSDLISIFTSFRVFLINRPVSRICQSNWNREHWVWTRFVQQMKFWLMIELRFQQMLLMQWIPRTHKYYPIIWNVVCGPLWLWQPFSWPVCIWIWFYFFLHFLNHRFDWFFFFVRPSHSIPRQWSGDFNLLRFFGNIFCRCLYSITVSSPS